MLTRALLLAAGLTAASLAPAFADSVTAHVVSWDAANRALTLEDMSQFTNIPATLPVPDMKAGDLVTVEYLGDDNGWSSYVSITLTGEDISKRLVPSPAKKG